MAAELAQNTRSSAAGRYYLGGMCLAGYVAYAIARELCQQGEEVAFLAVIDMPVPEYARLSRVAALRYAIRRLRWHVHRILEGDGQQKIARIAESFGGLSWHTRHRAWLLARYFSAKLGDHCLSRYVIQGDSWRKLLAKM